MGDEALRPDRIDRARLFCRGFLAPAPRLTVRTAPLPVASARWARQIARFNDTVDEDLASLPPTIEEGDAVLALISSD